ncbi:MAG: transcriptional regulator [marine bacterium B5-7]|nr:MAG: transcriptional regulator [marine bacterium B5-7]
MELRNLRTLVSIADSGTFAAAGQKIGLTQSAVSLQIRQLEREFGVPLFDRSCRPQVLNATGRSVVEKSREVLALCDEIRESTNSQAISASQETQFKLGSVATVTSGVLPDVLSKLAQALPELQVELFSDLSVELTRRVRDSELDAAIVSMPDSIDRGLNWMPCFNEPLVVIAHREVRETGYREILGHHPFIRFHRDAYAGRLIENQILAEGIRVKSSMEMNSLEAISRMVSKGLGVAVVPRRNIAKPFPSSVRTFPFGRLPTYRVVGLVAPSKNPKARYLNVLRELLTRAGNP